MNEPNNRINAKKILGVIYVTIGFLMVSTANALTTFDAIVVDGNGTSTPFIRFDPYSELPQFIVGFNDNMAFWDGNSYSFYIYRTAASGQLILRNNSVGINEDDPTSTLDIKAAFGEKAALKVTNVGGQPGGIHTILNLASNGPPSLRLRDNFNNETWQFRAKQNGGFTMNNAATPGLELEIEKDGKVKFRNNVSVNGVVVHASSRTLKENFKSVDAQGILEKVIALPVQQWNYIRDEDSVKHIGPMAEDFYSTFELGATQKGISSVDVSGIAFVAIQGLKKEKDNEVGSLQQLLDEKNHDIQMLNVTLNQNKVQILTLQQANDEKEKRISKLEEQLDRLNALERTVATLIERPFDGLQQTALVQQ